MEPLNKYKELKNILNIVYEEIYFNKVLALDIWNWANDARSFPVKRLFYYIMSLNLKTIKTCCDKSTILTTYGLYDARIIKNYITK